MITASAVCSSDTHERIKRTPAEWVALPSLGMMPAYDDERPKARIELRNCRCGSTLAKETES